jgi:3-methylcrotonyl-CoA carboxylase alpha subunit
MLDLVCDDEAFLLSIHPEGDGWRVDAGGEAHAVSGMLDDEGRLMAMLDGVHVNAAFQRMARGFTLIHEGMAYDFVLPDPLDVDLVHEGEAGGLKAPMPGKVVQVMAAPGVRVRKGEALVVMEAMKMEQTLAAAADGVIASVNVSAGDQVEAGAVLVAFEESVTA